MRQSYRIIYNSLTNYGAAFIQGIVGFFLIAYIVRSIGKDAYGVVLLVITALSVVEVLGMGLSKAVMKHVAEQQARLNIGLVNVIVSSSSLWFLFLGVLGTAVTCLIGYNFQSFVSNMPSEYVSDGKISMYIMAGSIAPCLVFDVFKGVLQAEQRYDLVNLIGVSRSLFRMLATAIYFEVFEASIVAVVAIYAIAHVIERILYALLSFKVVVGLSVSLKDITWRGLHMVIGLAMFIMVASVAGILITHVLKYVVARELGPADVTHLGVILLLAGFVNQLVRSFVNVLVPVASKYQGLENTVVNQKLLVYGTKYAAIIVLATAGMTMPLLSNILELWMGPDFRSLWPLGVVAFTAQIIVSFGLSANQILSGLGKVGFIASTSLIWSGVGLLLSWLYFHKSTEASLCIGYSVIGLSRITNIVFVVCYSKHVLKISWKELISPNVLKVLIIAILIMIGTWGAITFIDIQKWWQLITSILLIEIVFFLLVGCCCLDPDEKYRIKELFNRFKEKISVTQPHC